MTVIVSGIQNIVIDCFGSGQRLIVAHLGLNVGIQRIIKRSGRRNGVPAVNRDRADGVDGLNDCFSRLGNKDRSRLDGV